MEMPAERRERLVMGLSICALILLVANIATFVKQKFFEDQHEAHHAYVISGMGSEGNVFVEAEGANHEWHVTRTDGNEVWAIQGDNRRVRNDRRRAVKKRARFAWRLHGDHVDGSQDAEVEMLLEEARRAARSLELDLGLKEMPRLHIESMGSGVNVIESQDEAGRHTYRIVVKPDSER
ncbi:MAG: hypothetical protein ACI9W4_000532 [Rhodothermales bacterium]|jgi:hypothetical protein